MGTCTEGALEKMLRDAPRMHSLSATPAVEYPVKAARRGAAQRARRHPCLPPPMLAGRGWPGTGEGGGSGALPRPHERWCGHLHPGQRPAHPGFEGTGEAAHRAVGRGCRGAGAAPGALGLGPSQCGPPCLAPRQHAIDTVAVLERAAPRRGDTSGHPFHLANHLIPAA
jgi:hypothetical protein